MRLHYRVSTSAVFVVALAAVACLDSVSPQLDAPHSVAAVSVTPTSAQVPLGKHFSFDAIILDQSGNPMSGTQVGWTSSDTSIATVTSNGTVATKKLGSTLITATSDSKAGSATITVIPPSVATVDLSPASASLHVGQSLSLTATPRDDEGDPLADRPVTWASANTGVAKVSASGTVSAVGTGTTQITATSEGISASATITVSNAPVATVSVTPATVSLLPAQSAQLHATLHDNTGATLTGRTVTWSSSNTTVASVSSAGLVTAVAKGSATISATSEGKSGSAAVTISNMPVASVTVAPAAVTLDSGSSAQLTPTLHDQNGAVLTGRIVSWSTNNSAAATVSSTGRVTAVGAGTAKITATSEGKSGISTVTVVVLPAAVASVSVSPASDTVVIGATTQLTATAKDANDNTLGGRTFTWASSNTGVATVSSAGLVTGVADGTVTISASTGGKTGTAKILVTMPPVASVNVTPGTASVVVGSTVTLSAATYDANGRQLTGRAVSWRSSSATIASVSSTGLVTGIAAGRATIYATSEGKTDSAAITVSAAPVATVSVTPTTASLVVGGGPHNNSPQLCATQAARSSPAVPSPGAAARAPSPRFRRPVS